MVTRIARRQFSDNVIQLNKLVFLYYAAHLRELKIEEVLDPLFSVQNCQFCEPIFGNEISPLHL